MIRRCMVLGATVLGATLVLGLAAARQPVTSPLYYLVTAPVLEDGVPVRGELTADDGRNFKDGSYLDVLVLRGVEGTLVELTVSSIAFDTYLTLFAPDGSLLASNDDDWMAGGTDSAVRTTLPVTGTYVVVVSGYSERDLGPYVVTLREVVLAGGRRLELDGVTEDVLAPGGRAVYEVLVEEPTVLGAELRSHEFDTYLEVMTSDGWLVAENDDVAGSTDSALVVRLEPGTYHVVVTAYGGWGGGAFELELARYQRAR